jgi:glycosyltransferase involved in cell wall biosynthesis
MIIGIDASRYNLPNPTGVEKYTNTIIEGILREPWKGSKLRFYVRNSKQKQKLQENAKCENFEVTIIHWPFLWTLLGLSIELYFHPINTLFIPSHTLPLYTPKKSIITIHGIEALLFPKAYTWFQSHYQKWSLHQLIKKKAHTICVSESIKNELIKHLSLPTTHYPLLTTIHNGFTPPAHMSDLETVKNKYHLPEKYILSIGRIEPRKNQLSLIKAFEDIAIEEKDLHLILAGKPGTDGQSIIKRATSSRFANRITVLGYTPQADLNTILKNAHIFTYPSLAEGFGIPILEAMSLGIPVLTSNESACREVSGDAAVLINPHNIESLKEGLKKMLTDEELLHKLSLQGQERAKDFSWKKCVDETIKIIKKT